MAHVLISILGLCLFFLIMRSMIRIALINRHYRDWFAEAAGRAVYVVISLRLRRNPDTRVLHAILLWFFPAYLLSLILVYFVGAMIAFVLLYWGMGAGWGIGPIGLIVAVLVVAFLLNGRRGRL